MDRAAWRENNSYFIPYWSQWEWINVWRPAELDRLSQPPSLLLDKSLIKSVPVASFHLSLVIESKFESQKTLNFFIFIAYFDFDILEYSLFNYSKLYRSFHILYKKDFKILRKKLIILYSINKKNRSFKGHRKIFCKKLLYYQFQFFQFSNFQPLNDHIQFWFISNKIIRSLRG